MHGKKKQSGCGVGATQAENLRLLAGGLDSCKVAYGIGFTSGLTMIRSELIARIVQQNPHLTGAESEAIVRAVLDRISDALADGDRVELRDFGTFCIRDREACASRNPRTVKPVDVPARAHVQFKPEKGMRVRLDLKRAEPEPEAEVQRLLRTG